MWSLKLLLIPAAIYVLLVAFLFFMQTSMVFPARHVGLPGPLPPEAEPLALEAGPGVRLSGVFIPASLPGPTRTLILGFGGNAADSAGTALMLRDLYPETDVVSFYYRGYPPSGGRPGADALREDAARIHDAMRARLRPHRVVAVGFSVGSGVASALAAQRELDGLILVTPFDSLAKVAAGHYRWVPVALLFRHRLEPARDLARVRTPVAILAGARDRLIVPARTEALRRAIPNLVFDRIVPGAGHNDIYDHAAFRPSMREALAGVVATPRASS